jgi:CheY-like chemotaxis protein
VRVRLPIAPAAADEHAAPAPAPAATRARILVVDDEPMVRDLVRAILHRVAEVRVAASGAEALEHLREAEAYDLVLCDLMMPEMSGAELCRRLEAERPSAARRFAFMTGGAATEALDRYLEASPRPRLDKPFTPPELRAFVFSQLDAPIG